MSKLTEKQLRFVRAKAEGLSHEKAMIAAGYSPAGASQNATAMMKKPGVQQAIRAAKRERLGPTDRAIDDARAAKGLPPEGEADDPKNKMPKEHYTDAKEFLMDMMNNKNFGLTTRAGYAVQLLPYQHAKIGEKGKKDNDQDAAAEATGGKKQARVRGKAGNVTPLFSPGRRPRIKGE